jgi:16S rRNA (cytosine967-C5)-methyltransferase
MTPAARISAAIEVLEDIEARHRPAMEALKDWGSSHRFAGSKDRNAIGSLVYDALRRRASARWIMGAEDARATVLGMLRIERGLDLEGVAALFTGEGHGPALLTEGERDRLVSGSLDGAPVHVAGDFPEWLTEAITAAFGERAAVEGAALSQRAPVDLRVNLLRGDRAKATRQLAHLSPEPTPLSPWGLRVPLAPDGRSPALSAEPAYAKGLVEIQDEGSQLASLLSSVNPGHQVLDLCAGGGGKSLAFAAMMENRGQIYATDTDGRRLMPIYPRLERANARNVQVRAPRGQQDVLSDLGGRCDVVFVDAPCTGTGAWRRNPDAKWRIRPGALEQRLKQQDEVLDRAVRYLRPGGVLVYVTCSVLRVENEDRVAAFLERNPTFLPRDAAHMARLAGVPELAAHASPHGPGLRLSPASSGTDGFYVAALIAP